MMRHTLAGIALYNIELDGCLSGVYSNDDEKVAGEIFNEICRKRKTSNTSEDSLVGTYDCFYFDLKNERCSAILEIDNHKKTYLFTWKDIDGKKVIFEGVGYKMNNNQIAVHYTG